MRKELIGIMCESLETNHWLHESLTLLVEIPVGDKPMKVIIRIFGIGLCELIRMKKTWSRFSSSWNNDLLPARKSRFSGRHGSNTLRWTCMKGIRIFGTWGWRKLGTMLMLSAVLVLLICCFPPHCWWVLLFLWLICREKVLVPKGKTITFQGTGYPTIVYGDTASSAGSTEASATTSIAADYFIATGIIFKV